MVNAHVHKLRQVTTNARASEINTLYMHCACVMNHEVRDPFSPTFYHLDKQSAQAVVQQGIALALQQPFLYMQSSPRMIIPSPPSTPSSLAVSSSIYH